MWRQQSFRQTHVYLGMRFARHGFNWSFVEDEFKHYFFSVLESRHLFKQVSPEINESSFITEVQSGKIPK